MKRFMYTSALAVVAASAGVGMAQAQEDCGSVVIASMNWQSAEVLSEVDKFILENGYGCSAEIITSDTVPALTSMIEKGQPDVAPEGWVDLLPDVVERGIKDGKIVSAGPALSDGAVQGWWIPKYLADEHPDIKTISDALDHPELFPAPEDSSKGAVYNGPQGWGGTAVSEQLFKAYDGAEKGFVLVDSGSAAGLDGSMAKAYERKDGWLGYYWAPTSMLGKYEMVKLDHGAELDMDQWENCITVPECPDPQPTDWPVDSVETLLTTDFAERAGEGVMEYYKARSWSNDTVNGLMAWMTDNQASGEEAAIYFLQNNEDLWKEWLPEDVAEKIRDSIS